LLEDRYRIESDGYTGVYVRMKTIRCNGLHKQRENNRMHWNIYIYKLKTTGCAGIYIQIEDNRMHWNT